LFHAELGWERKSPITLAILWRANKINFTGRILCVDALRCETGATENARLENEAQSKCKGVKCDTAFLCSLFQSCIFSVPAKERDPQKQKNVYNRLFFFRFNNVLSNKPAETVTAFQARFCLQKSPKAQPSRLVSSIFF